MSIKIKQYFEELFNVISDSKSSVNSYKINKSSFTGVKVFDKSLYNSSFIPLKIRRSVEKDCKYTYNTELVIGIKQHKINVYIYSENPIIMIDEIFDYINVVLNMLYNYSSDMCVKNRTIHLIMLSIPKCKPRNREIISPINVNSAVTTGCNLNNEIIIFREEEWCKTLIHELFHSLGLDFSLEYNKNHLKIMRETYNIKSRFLIFETYAETMATLIYISLISYNLSEIYNQNRENIIKEYIYYCLSILKEEQEFSLKQMKYILDYNNTTIKSILNMNIDNDYRENSNVFCYYILKTGLLMNIENTIEWLNMNNCNIFQFNNEKITDFIELIERNMKLIQHIKLPKYVDISTMRMVKNDIF